MPSKTIGKDKISATAIKPRASKSLDAVVVEESSGNVFADLGLQNPEQELLKAQLTLQIYRILRDRKLTQVQAGVVLGIKQPHVSLLMRNRAGSFSVWKLMEFLTTLGQDVAVVVKPARSAQGKLSVLVG
jgi:predicted XRE-type DNA-binding protein